MANKVLVFVTDGFEETEAIVPIDILRRAKLDVKIVSLTGNIEVKGKHGLQIKADALFDEVKNHDFKLLLIPGGTIDYLKYDGLIDLVLKRNANGQLISAICAAPAVFGKAGILNNKKATIYPGMSKYLGDKAIFSDEDVVVDGNIITARGPGVSFKFALTLLEILEGREKVLSIKKDFLL